MIKGRLLKKRIEIYHAHNYLNGGWEQQRGTAPPDTE